MSKGDFAKVTKQEGDWIQVANIWEDKGDAWIMYQNKKGKQLAEAAPDPGSAEAEFAKVEGWLKSCRAALADGKEPPPDPRAPPPAADGGGFGVGGGGGFNSDAVGGVGAKKAVSDEEAELLAMLKGFGSNAFAEGEAGGEGGAPPPPPAEGGGNASGGANKPHPSVSKPKAKPKPAAAASSGGEPPPDMSEEELLAMLKGCGSGAPAGVAGGDGGGGAAGTIEERIDDSDFKVRKQAYVDLAELFNKEQQPEGGGDSVGACFEMKAVGGEHIVEAAAKEKNAMAFVDGIGVCEAFFLKAPAQN
jgi:hypothetical protein